MKWKTHIDKHRYCSDIVKIGLTKFLDYVVKREKIWLTNRDEIAQYWTKHHPFETDWPVFHRVISDKEVLEFVVAASCLKYSIDGDVNLITLGEVKKLIWDDRSGRVLRWCYLDNRKSADYFLKCFISKCLPIKIYVCYILGSN